MMRTSDFYACDVMSPHQASFTSTSTSTSTSTQEPQTLFSRWPAKQSYASPWHSVISSLPRPSQELQHSNATAYVNEPKPSIHPQLYLHPLPSNAPSTSSSWRHRWEVDSVKASTHHHINDEVVSTTTTTTEFTTTATGHEPTCSSPDSWSSHALSSPPSSPPNKLQQLSTTTTSTSVSRTFLNDRPSPTTVIKKSDKKTPKLRRNRPVTLVKKKSSEGRTCEHCRAPSSPAWRRGPSGWLCNRCGLRYHATLKSAPRNVMALSFVLN